MHNCFWCICRGRLFFAFPTFPITLLEGPEGVNWELGFTFFEGWELVFFHWDWDFFIEIGINTLKFGLGLSFLSTFELYKGSNKCLKLRILSCFIKFKDKKLNNNSL